MARASQPQGLAFTARPSNHRRCLITQTQTATPTPKKAQTPERAEAARNFAIDVARLAANTRCHNVVVLDVRSISPITDYFVLATGTSARQMRTVTDEVEELGQQRGYKPLSRSGYEGETWLLCDMVDVILHVFNQDSRQFYDLDALWGDAPRVEWKPADAAAATPTA